MANVDIQVGKKDSTFFSTNPTLVLKNGQLIYNETTLELFIGDGVTQLSSLVAINGGGSQDLASVLGFGNSTGEINITSDDTFSKLVIESGEATLKYDNGVTPITYISASNGVSELINNKNGGYIGCYLGSSTIAHDLLINLNSLSVKKNSVEIATVNDIVQVNTSTIGSAINGATDATPNDTDLVMSVETSVAKKNTWTQIKAFLKSYFDTVYQVAGSYLTSANITQVITNGVTDKAPSEDAVFDALALKKDINKGVTIIYRDFTASSALTGTTAITLINSALISANTVVVNDEIEIYARAQRNTATGVHIPYLYYNTSASLSGATLIGTGVSTASGSNLMSRRLFVKASNDTETIPAASASFTDYSSTTGTSMSSLNIDWTNNVYIIQAHQNAANGDSTTSRGIIIKRSRL